MSGFRSHPRLDDRFKAALAADRALVASLLELDSGLSRWEVGFLESIARDVDAGVALSLNQRDKAEQIARDRGVPVTRRPES